MTTIRSFIYLDEDKLYSYSSQIFEGLTEYIINTRTKAREENDSGPIAPKSSQILASIFREHSATEEKRFLFDHAYKLLEDKLVSDGAVLDISCANVGLVDLGGYDFVRVKGTVAFNDVRFVRDFVSQINSIGDALAYVTNYKAISEAKEEIARRSAASQDRNKKAAAQAMMSSALSKLSEQGGLHFDQKFIDHLNRLLAFGFEDQFEIRMQLADVSSAQRSAFSAMLKRDRLRETEGMIMRKYARKTEREFTLFGVVAQAGSLKSHDDMGGVSHLDEMSEPENVRAKLLKLINHFVTMDNAMSGRSPNEVIVDPIAVYLDVQAGTPAAD